MTRRRKPPTLAQAMRRRGDVATAERVYPPMIRYRRIAWKMAMKLRTLQPLA